MTNQTVSKSENVIQVAGNMEVRNGLAVHEVRELTHLFMRENFPTLRAEAIAAAEQNARNFVETFEQRLATKLGQVDPEKFKDPDIQASLNDAVIEAAKKGARGNTDILCDLILERASAKTDDYVSLVAAEAIKVVPRLTPRQIGFLTLAVFLRHMKLSTAKRLADLNPLADAVLAASRDSFGLSRSQKSHLEFVGCVSILDLVTNTAYAIWKAEYDFLKDVPETDLKEQMERESPSMHALANAFDENNVAQVSLTSVGQLIGLAHLARRLGPLNYATWLS